ncbi:MAG TPA: hypothetical protein V6D23_11580, partial [Candidatus Obscuribacterales bacterium]
MIRPLRLSLSAVLLLASGALAGTAPGREIRRIDFLNHRFPSSLCTKTWFEGARLSLKAGKLETAESYALILDKKIAYGD